MTSIKDLKPDSHNANRGSARGQKQIVGSIQRNGFGRSGLLDKDGRVIAGNKTLEASAEVFGVEADVIIVESDGTKPVYVKRTDLDLDDPDPSNPARRLAYEDNVSSWLSFDLDPAVVMADMESGFDFEAIGVNLEELGEMLEGSVTELLGGGNGEVKDAPPQIDKAKELQAKWGTELGQVWELGEHRIVCGDCTDPAVVEAVMRGEKADMLFTDPPYNTGETWSGLQEYRGHAQVENDNRQDWQVWALACLTLWLKDALGDDFAGYWWFGQRESPRGLIKQSGLNVRGHIVWVKEHFNVGRADYHSQYEECQYFSKGERFWKGARNQSDVRTANRVEEERLHPTQKPLSLVFGMIEQHSTSLVFDPFLGSGTTLIACENLGRKCRGIEIDPGYAAVTIQRWTDLTSRDPIRVSG